MTSPETEIDEQAQEPKEKPKLNLDVQVDAPSTCERHITVTVALEDVTRYFEEAFTELMPGADVPGFRSGRAPRKLVEQRFREQVSDQVKGSLLMDAMAQVREDQEFSAISEPDFDFEAIEIPDSGPLTFEFSLEVRPEFDLPKWKGLSLDKLVRDFTKKDIDRQVQEMLTDRGELVSRDGELEANDYAIVNVKVRQNGRVIAEVDNASVQIKSILSFPDGRLEGFDKLMIGAKPGDKRNAKVTISHDAPVDELQGAEVDVDFEVLDVQTIELPELNEELLTQTLEVDNEGELRDRVKSDLERRLAYQQQRRVRRQITSTLTQAADWELPPDLVKRQSRREMERATLEMRSSGYGEDEIQAYEHEMRQNSLATTKTALQEHFILERIAEDEGIEAEPDDFNAEISMIASQSREPARRVRARIEKKGLMDALRNQIIERKVVGLIEKHAKFKEVKYKPEGNETEPFSLPLSGREETEIPSAKHGGDAQPLQQPTDRA